MFRPEEVGEALARSREQLGRATRITRRLITELTQEKDDALARIRQLEQQLDAARGELAERIAESEHMAREIARGQSKQVLCPSCFESRGLGIRDSASVGCIGERRCHDCGTLVPQEVYIHVDQRQFADVPVAIGMKSP
jgi:hypothetical protein